MHLRFHTKNKASISALALTFFQLKPTKSCELITLAEQIFKPLNELVNPESKIASFLRKQVSVTDQEAALFSSYFEEVTLRKKQLVVQPGFPAKYRYYVISGAMRSFIVHKSGQETTIAMAVEDWWITDYNSYIYQQPATLFVEAITNCTVLQLSHESELRLKDEHPLFERFFRIVAEKGLAAQQRRLITNLTHSAEERYTDFIEKYPQFLQLVPQYVLASYLGMTTEFLSKIRNDKVKPKS